MTPMTTTPMTPMTTTPTMTPKKKLPLFCVAVLAVLATVADRSLAAIASDKGGELQLPPNSAVAREVTESQIIKLECKKEAQNLMLQPNQRAAINCQVNWTSIDVTVSFTDASLSLYFDSVERFSRGDTFSVSVPYANNTSKEIHNGLPDHASKSWMPTVQKTLRIQAKTTAEKPFSLKLTVFPKCGGIFEGDFTSPLLPSKGVETTAKAVCSFKVSRPSLFTFSQVSLQPDSQLLFTHGVAESFKGPFQAMPEYDIVGKVNTEFELTLNMRGLKQNVTLKTTPVSGDVCGPEAMYNATSRQVSISTDSSKASSQSVFCVWVVGVDPGHVMRLQIVNWTLEHGADILSVIDSGKLEGKPVLQVTSSTKSVEKVISSKEYLVITLMSNSFTGTSEKVNMTVDLVSSGGHLSEKGKMVFSTSSDYFLSTLSNQSIVVGFGNLHMVKGAAIMVYTDFTSDTALLTFSMDNPPFDISSPGSELRIVATGFTQKNTTVAFESVPRGSGCLRTFVAAQESNMRMEGSCDGQCQWIIRPQVANPPETSLFFAVHPNNVPWAKISRLSDNDVNITMKDSSEPFMLGFSADKGAHVEFECQNFQMSYLTESTNLVRAVYGAPGQNITLMSPFFPGLYPQGVEFKYQVTFNGTNDTYLAAFDTMDLLPGQTLSFAKKLEFTGSDRPSDFFIPTSTLSQVTLNTVSSHKLNLRASRGFRVNLAPLAASSELAGASGNVTIPAGLCTKLPCVYIVNMTMPHDIKAGVAVNLTLATPGNKSLPVGDLLVWDGESTLRSPLVASPANLSRSGLFSSRSPQLIVRYRGAEPLSFEYKKVECSFDSGTMCLGDRTCIPHSWHCDHIAQCADGSDEFFCGGGPTPTPPPPSSNGWKTAFFVCVPLFMLLTVLLTKGAPVAWQRFRESQYQPFHDLGDH